MTVYVAGDGSITDERLSELLAMPLRTVVELFLAGDIPVGGFKTWTYATYPLGVTRFGDEEQSGLGHVWLIAAEHDYGHRTDDELRAVAREWLDEQRSTP